MKKLTLIMAMAFLAVTAFAQQPLPMTSAGKYSVPMPKVFNPNKSRYATGKLNPTNTATTQEYWINWGDSREFVYQSAVVYGSYLFPDSSALALYGGNTWDYVSIHNAMDILDVKSVDFQVKPGITWNQFTSYDVDSLDLLYVYNRTNPNANVVDTVIFKIFADYAGATGSNVVGQWTTGTWPTLQSDYQTDTLRCMIPKYVYTTNSPNPGTATMMTVKVPLTTNDSSKFIADLIVKLPSVYTVGANKILISSFAFKPGVAYTMGDSIGGKKLNDFRFISFEEQGASSLPLYTKCTPFKTNKCDWNESAIVPSSVKYNANGQGWNGYEIPMWLYTKPYGLEHHQLWYKVTSTTVGIKENTANGGIMLAQTMPNPTNGNTVIEYMIPTNAPVSLEIHDITGKKVMTINEGNKLAGSHSINFNVSSLNKGVYMYTLKAGEFNVTKKMTVID